MTFRKQEDIEVERENHSLENSLWKGLWTRRTTRLPA